MVIAGFMLLSGLYTAHIRFNKAMLLVRAHTNASFTFYYWNLYD